MVYLGVGIGADNNETKQTKMTTTKTLAEKITDHLNAGGVVRVATHYRYTDYTKKHADWFTTGSDGCTYVRRGRGKDCIASPSGPLVKIMFSKI